LIYDKINNEELWNIFFKNIDKNKYNIYIHYKSDNKLKYFEEYKLDNCIETKYADVSLIHASIILFKKAYEEGCDKFVLVSQACIPLKSFDYVYNFLTKDDFGHFNIADKKKLFPRFNSLLDYYSENSINKSSQWIILNRKICEFIINCDKNKINKEYTNIYAPEEIFFITLIFENNLQNEIITTQNLAKDATTFTNWHDMQYKYVSKKYLKNYDSIEKEELLYLLKSKCLFGRKFDKECFSNLYIKEYLDFITQN
jgi:hypothetical protein